MRELTLDELEVVSGGWLPGDDVVVTGPGGGGGNVPTTPTNPGGGGGGGGGGSLGAEAVMNFVTWAIDHAIAEQKAAEERESKVATQFNPNVAGEVGTSRNGHPFWQMPDGDIYVDMSGNMKPDMILRYAPNGSVFSNDGSGWTDTGKIWQNVPPRQ